MEGLLTIVRKDGARYGKLEGIVTVRGTEVSIHTPGGGFVDRRVPETIDGVLQMQADPVGD